jgi:hypothetical protein
MVSKSAGASQFKQGLTTANSKRWCIPLAWVTIT